MDAKQSLKDQLVRLGPDNFVVRWALKHHSNSRGYTLRFKQDRIEISKKRLVMFLSKMQYVQVPFMIENFDFYFNTTVPERRGELTVLDFSKPGLHRYTRSGVTFLFPSVPEDDVMDAYTHWHTPIAGETVWDVGAHAGASVYFFSLMVGPSGQVYAFEPDDINYQYLKKNIENHRLQNVIPVKKALAGETGTAKFNMDGTLSAGLSDYLVYSNKRLYAEVETLTLPDACAELGCIPHLVKMDIEGAEVAVIQSAKVFLRNQLINFSIESNHKVAGELTCGPLEHLFHEIGYKAFSSKEFGQMFTWARPGN